MITAREKQQKQKSKIKNKRSNHYEKSKHHRRTGEQGRKEAQQEGRIRDFRSVIHYRGHPADGDLILGSFLGWFFVLRKKRSRKTAEEA